MTVAMRDELERDVEPAAGGSAGADLAARLGLDIDPLAPDALPDFFFVGGRRRFVVQQVVHALYFAGGITLLTGDRGAGKSRVLSEVCRELASLADICRIEATVLMDAGELRAQMASALGLSTAADNNEALLDELDRLRPAGADVPPVALIVDDAHLLAVPDLAECEALVEAAGGRVRLLLAGEAELQTAWEQVGANAEHIELPALQLREAADYLNTRLQAAGYRDELPLSQNQLQELMRHSRGNIAEIHAVAPLLLGGRATGRSSSPGKAARKLPLSYIGIGAAALALTAVLLLALGSRGGNSPEPSDRVALPLPIGADAQPGAPATAAPMQSDPESSVPLPAPAMVQREAPPAPAEPAAVERAPVAAAVAPVAPAPVAAAAPVTQAQPKAAKPAPAKAVAAKPAANKAAAPASAKTTAAKPKPAAAKPAKPAASADERRLLALPEQQYVVQLMAGYSRDKVAGFIAGNGAGVKVLYFESRLQGKPWYVAVTGPYPDRGAASAAIARLSPALRKEKPWPRSVASIQADLRGRAAH